MADFNIAFQRLLENQGMALEASETRRDTGKILLCSNCFKDEGLRLDAWEVGLKMSRKCPNCGEKDSKKLTRQLVRDLCYRFFVRGTIERFDYGGFPLIQMNEHYAGRSEINVPSWLEDDVKLVEKAGGVGFFYYGPRFWMFGEIEPLKALQNTEEIDSVVDRILQLYPTSTLNRNTPFFRIRVNPETPNECHQYDSPPEGLGGQNRFDSNGEPILYGSPDLQLCIHECRVTVEDNLYVAKLVPTGDLKVLNLAAIVREKNVTEFTSLDLAIHFLFLARKHSYAICGHIAKRIREAGYDGIIYPSYFSYFRTGAIPFETITGMSIRLIEPLINMAESQSIPNVALFGRPIAEKKVKVHSINKLLINSISYQTSFGPIDLGSK